MLGHIEWRFYAGLAGIRQKDGAFRLNVSVPPGLAAEVHLPAASPDRLGMTDAPGSRFLRSEAGRAAFEIPSGDYRFTAR